MDYQYDKKNDLLSIKFNDLLQQIEEGAGSKTFPTELQSEIGLLFSNAGQLTGLEISPASKYFAEKKLAAFIPKVMDAGEKQDTAIQHLSMDQYTTLDAPVLFEDKENDQYYGMLQLASSMFKFGWIREQAFPMVKWLDEHMVAIGVDKHFVIVNGQTAEKRLNIPLNTYFVDLSITDNALLVITQLEIFKINTVTYEISNTFDLPDFFVSIEILGDIYKVRCFDGSELSLS